MPLTVRLESPFGQSFLTLILHKDTDPVLEVLLGSILRRLMPWQLADFRHAASNLEEVYLVKRVLLITTPIDFEDVYD